MVKAVLGKCSAEGDGCKVNKEFLLNYARKVYHRIDRYYTEFVIRHGRIQKNKIVFDNFWGRGYGENPKYITEEIHRENLKCDLVWLYSNEQTEFPPYVRKIPYGSNKAKRELATAKVVVNNIRNSMRVQKKKGQIYMQTWHGGLGFKKVEAATEDQLPLSYIQEAKRDGAECDAILSSCALQTAEYRQCFWLNEKTEILEFGLPRCDILFADQREIKESVYAKYGLSRNVKIILYAPTFRDDRTVDGYALDYPGVLKAFEEKIGMPCVLIVRLHPNVQYMQNQICYNEKILNGSIYPDIQELYIAADALITDYSSAAFDCALLGKPVFLCALDHEKYEAMRGLTPLFYQVPFSRSYTNEALIREIASFSQTRYIEAVESFKNSVWKPFDDGNASKRVVGWIRQRLT